MRSSHRPMLSHPEYSSFERRQVQSDTAMRNKNRLFGDLELAWGDSRMEDMLNDDSPYCDYSNREDELYGYLERMIGQEVPSPPPKKNLVVSSKTLIFAANN